MFAISGIVLNHRKAFSGIDISRKLLPKHYEYENWDNGSVARTLTLRDRSVWIYGGIGVWQTDSLGTHFDERNAGLPTGADHIGIRSVVETRSGGLYALSPFALYKYDEDVLRWSKVDALPKVEKYYTDLIVQGDSLLLLSRSHLYVRPSGEAEFREIEFMAPEGYSPKVSLFRMLWLLHSGELFGLSGQLVVDGIALILIVLCVTGLIITIRMMVTKNRKRKGLRTSGAVIRKSLKLHNKLGSLFLVLLLLITITGMFLRPPLMIAVIRSKVCPLPGTELSSDNPWHDKLRKIRFDQTHRDWLLSTSDGFFALRSLESVPIALRHSPPISVMGINTWQQKEDGKWIAGSFSGLFEWDRDSGKSFDLIEHKPYERPQGGIPTFTNAISGYSTDFTQGAILFDYNKGARLVDEGSPFVPMPQSMRPGRISLWHAALEMHVGRLYDALLGPIAPVFIFLSGLLLLSIIVTGYIIYRKWHRKKKRAR